MAEKEGGVVKKGHDEGIKMGVSLLEEFGLPMGLLPLADVVEVGFVRDTGYMWIVQKKKVEHSFKVISKLVIYDTDITGYVEMKRIKKLKGVKAKELLLWPPVSDNGRSAIHREDSVQEPRRDYQNFPGRGICSGAVKERIKMESSLMLLHNDACVGQ
ncbi:uncharacterized protein LOC130753791 [Actinidia eriantha]|uniref:uncharacterized protein LOC130753791 n=1 Tax=Actinidia eriantha TaxID=165200 RepID=UPI00258DD1CF|nr:uncharacterized protein LOC130753791 [Actinidia eriantha]